MFRTMHALALVVGLLGFAANAIGQDPVTERPGQVQPQEKETPAPAPQQPKAAAKPTATFEGTESLDGPNGNATPLAFHLYQDGKVIMIDADKKPVRGSIKVEGTRMIITFSNCVYVATEAKGVVTGQARFTSGSDSGKTWTFRMTIRNPLVGRTFAGQETLPGYGPVSFRFIDGLVVEMTDKDGTVRGSYTQNGLQVTMTFGATSYVGSIRDGAITGSARDTKNNWTFHVSAGK